MMKSRLSLRNLVKRGPPLSLILLFYIISGCSSSTAPTYLKENITESIRDICKKEYELDVTTRLVGETLWVYLALEDIIVEDDKEDKAKSENPFSVSRDKGQLSQGLMELEYLIELPAEEKVKQPGYKYNEAALEKINNVWRVLLRTTLSMDPKKKDGPKIFCLVYADIKNGLELKEVFYYLDLKKLVYSFISRDEFRHRAPQDINMRLEAIGDKEGGYLNYKNITLEDFIIAQIEHRIRLKFGKPEVDKNADIDKEIAKIVAHTLRIYAFRDFNAVRLNNLLTNKSITLNRAAILERSSEQKF